jgi:hypothetical protein
MTRIRTMLMDQQPVGEPELRGDERREAARSGGSPTGERRQEALPDPEVPAPSLADDDSRLPTGSRS